MAAAKRSEDTAANEQIHSSYVSKLPCNIVIKILYADIELNYSEVYGMLISSLCCCRPYSPCLSLSKHSLCSNILSDV